jgi:transposase
MCRQAERSEAVMPCCACRKTIKAKENIINFKSKKKGGIGVAKYKKIDSRQMFLLPVDFSEQIIPGSFEYALNQIIDHKINLEIFALKYNNNETGAPAFSPAVLLKIVLYAYSKGIISSRKIAKACQNNIVFIALSGNTSPHFTTIADFVSQMHNEIKAVFLNVLLVCDELKLIGGQMFAIDGCKLASNASKEFSGTFKDLQKKKDKYEQLAKKLLDKHSQEDLKKGRTRTERQSEEIKVERILRKASKIEKFLKNCEKKMGSRGKENQSNVTDNESAKIKSSHGVIQGYNGLAVTDSKKQIVVYPEAFGSGQEGGLLKELVEKTQKVLTHNRNRNYQMRGKTILADTNYFSEENLKYLGERKIKAIIPDQQFRKRDERFAERDRHNPKTKNRKYEQEDFKYDEAANEYICPAGKRLVYKPNESMMGIKGKKYKARQADCSRCLKRSKCLRNKESRQRTLMFTEKKARNYSKEMIEKIDQPEIRKLYGKRMGIVEPVFGNITYCKGMNRFTLRSKAKVNIQWNLYCLVHNIEKISRTYGEKWKEIGLN